MELKNVYTVNGYINTDGMYEKNPGLLTFIAECKLYGEEGFSYYSFLNYDYESNSFIDNKLIRLERIMPLIENKDINIAKLDNEHFERYKTYFTKILEKQSNNITNKKELNL